MSQQEKLIHQLNWCIHSKKALGNFYAACSEAQKDVQRTFMMLQDSNFDECNRGLMELHFLFQKASQELTTEIIEFHLPYIEKQIKALSQAIH